MRILTSLILSLPLIGAYAIFAVGIVLIYRASRVINLAHGAMAMVPAYALFALSRAGLPLAIALPLALVFGAGLGVTIEHVFVRRLRSGGSTTQTVGTVAGLGLLLAISARIWGTSAQNAVSVFPRGSFSVGVSNIQYGELGLFVTMLVVATILFSLLQFTDLGLMMRGTAENRLGASLHGVNPDRITDFTWVLGGSTAALAGIMLAAVTTLQPYQLTLQALPGFIAALIGGLGSLPGALIGAAAIGIIVGLVPEMGAVGDWQGAPQLFIAVLAIVVMASRGVALAGSDAGSDR